MIERLGRYRGLFFFALIPVILAGVVVIQLRRPGPGEELVPSPTPVPSPSATATPGPIRVYVSGAVQKPDVYTLAPGSIIKDALLAAGGGTADADLDRINLAQQLSDGVHVYVPRVGEESLPVRLPDNSGMPAKINLNTADISQLESLPGIGPALAQRIVDYRTAHGHFERIEDITGVSGIGPSTFAQIQDLITVR